MANCAPRTDTSDKRDRLMGCASSSAAKGREAHSSRATDNFFPPGDDNNPNVNNINKNTQQQPQQQQQSSLVTSTSSAEQATHKVHSSSYSKQIQQQQHQQQYPTSHSNNNANANNASPNLSPRLSPNSKKKKTAYTPPTPITAPVTETAAATAAAAATTTATTASSDSKLEESHTTIPTSNTTTTTKKSSKKPSNYQPPAVFAPPAPPPQVSTAAVAATNTKEEEEDDDDSLHLVPATSFESDDDDKEQEHQQQQRSSNSSSKRTNQKQEQQKHRQQQQQQQQQQKPAEDFSSSHPDEDDDEDEEDFGELLVPNRNEDYSTVISAMTNDLHDSSAAAAATTTTKTHSKSKSKGKSKSKSSSSSSNNNRPIVTRRTQYSSTRSLEAPKPDSDSGMRFDELYRLKGVLGTGAFSTVREGFHRSNADISYAIKCINRKKLSEEDEAALLDEVAILKELKHVHIIRLFDFFTEPSTYYLVMERMRGGELFDRIVAKAYYNEKEARDTCKILLEAVEYCHDNHVAHRDLKPENLLLLSEDDDSAVKIADFGFAKRVLEPNSLTTQCGTPGYVAPEILEGTPYDERADMWSVGVILYILLGGYPPFIESTQRDLFRKIRKGEYEFHEEYWGTVSQEAKGLIRSLLTVSCTKRLTAGQALQNEWILGDDADLANRELGANLDKLRNFNAKRKFRAAVSTVMAANKLNSLGGAFFQKPFERDSNESLPTTTTTTTKAP